MAKRYDFTARDNLLNVAWQLTQLEKQQLPFATALALTKTIKEVQTGVKQRLGDQYTLRTDWTMRGIRISPASKRHLEAILYTKDWYMGQHEAGADRTPLKAKFLWVPTRAARQGGVKTGRILPKYRPKAIKAFWATNPQGRGGSKPGRKRGKTLKCTPFLATLKGIEGVWRRQGPDRDDGFKLLYKVMPTQDIPPLWGAGEAFGKIVARDLMKNFYAALDQAIKTRKK